MAYSSAQGKCILENVILGYKATSGSTYTEFHSTMSFPDIDITPETEDYYVFNTRKVKHFEGAEGTEMDALEFQFAVETEEDPTTHVQTSEDFEAIYAMDGTVTDFELKFPALNLKYTFTGTPSFKVDSQEAGSNLMTFTLKIVPNEAPTAGRIS
jgi:hypothetical protein